MLRKGDESFNNNEKASLFFVVSRASNLSQDLEDEDNLGDNDAHELPPVVVQDRKVRKKRSYDKKNVRRSNRIRIKKSKS
jgi:hypothetical protein